MEDRDLIDTLEGYCQMNKELNGCVMDCYSHPKGGWSATVHFEREVEVGTWLEHFSQARADLEAENEQLREELAELRKESLAPALEKSHRCIKCLHAYSPKDGESEDCPACGHDGSTLKDMK